MFHNLFTKDPHSSHRKKDYDFGPADSLPIGEGGYSRVMKAAWKSRGNQLVAIKVVRKEVLKEKAEYLKLLST